MDSISFREQILKQKKWPDCFRLQEEREQQRQLEQQRRWEAYEAEQKERAYQRALLHNNPRIFLETEGLYVYDPDGCISSQALYAIYKRWCITRRIPIHTPREFWLYVKEMAPNYGLSYTTNIHGADGKRLRGFRGIRPLPAGADDAHGTDNP